MIVHLARHGQSYNTHPSPDFPSSVNPPLTPTGSRQARLLAERLGRLGIDRILTSPMIRAVETANAIGQLAGRPVEVWPRCYEWRDTAGYPCAGGPELKRLFPDLLVSPDFAPNGWTYGSEPIESAVRRVDEMLEWLRDEARSRPSSRIVVATHGNFVRTLVARVIGADPLAGQLLEMHNSSVTTLKIAPRDSFIIGLNDTSHLAGEPMVDPAAGLTR